MFGVSLPPTAKYRSKKSSKEYLVPASRSFTFVVISSLTACAPFSPWPDKDETEKVSFTIDDTAVIIAAQYGRNYLLEGNIVARYQDFDFVRLSSETVTAGNREKSAGTYSVFEIRNREGSAIKRLLIGPNSDKQRLRFTVHGKSYFIKEGAKDSSFTISIPSHFLAHYHVVTPQ